jgi:hypothetical protein
MTQHLVTKSPKREPKSCQSDRSKSVMEREMTVNMGKTDRGLRLVVAALLLYAALGARASGMGALDWTLLAIAAVFIVTALMGNCPLYRILGLRTCR